MMTMEQMREICERYYATEDFEDVFADEIDAGNRCVIIKWDDEDISKVEYAYSTTWDGIYDYVADCVARDLTEYMTVEEVEEYLGAGLLDVFMREEADRIENVERRGW